MPKYLPSHKPKTPKPKSKIIIKGKGKHKIKPIEPHEALSYEKFVSVSLNDTLKETKEEREGE